MKDLLKLPIRLVGPYPKDEAGELVDRLLDDPALREDLFALFNGEIEPTSFAARVQIQGENIYKTMFPNPFDDGDAA